PKRAYLILRMSCMGLWALSGHALAEAVLCQVQALSLRHAASTAGTVCYQTTRLGRGNPCMCTKHKAGQAAHIFGKSMTGLNFGGISAMREPAAQLICPNSGCPLNSRSVRRSGGRCSQRPVYGGSVSG